MRRYVLPAVLLSLFFLAGRFCTELGVHADGNGVGAACAGNGDVNASGAIDISDALYLLNWLFIGGPAPKACAEAGGLTQEQADILNHMRIVTPPEMGGRKTLRISGLNVQIVNGLGATEGNPPGTTNGLGNLIVGYNELREASTDNRLGSHNLVVGTRQSYTSGTYGGLLAGGENTISAPYATVSGGWSNTASAGYAIVTGGNFNIASSGSATVSGGYGNVANGEGGPATVCGGAQNIASGPYATVSGGVGNVASGNAATVSGGYSNTATGRLATASGGQRNNAAGPPNAWPAYCVTISGGCDRTASAECEHLP